MWWGSRGGVHHRDTEGTEKRKNFLTTKARRRKEKGTGMGKMEVIRRIESSPRVFWCTAEILERGMIPAFRDYLREEGGEGLGMSVADAEKALVFLEEMARQWRGVVKEVEGGLARGN